jgi:hypothetical protein
MAKQLWIVALVAVLIVPVVARADFRARDWEVTLSGSGSNGPDFDGTTFTVGGNVGYFLTDEFEVGLRQSISFTDVNTGGDLNGSTRVALDYNFNLGQWVPYVGANLGYAYGDAVNDTWEAGPEAGVRYFVNNTTFIFLSAEYQFFFDNSENSFGSESFSDGQFIYGLGIGFKF